MQFDDFQQHTLANLEQAIADVEAEKLSLRQAVTLASVLLSHGHPKAARPINLLKREAQDAEVKHLAGQFEQKFVTLRQRFRFEELTPEQMDIFYRTEGLTYLRRNQRSSRLLVIFTNLFNNFYYSHAAMAGLLSHLDCDLLFLRDTSYFSYLNGAKGIAADFPGVGDKIVELAQRNAIEKIYVTGFSSAGFAALRTSLRIPCSGYLGFSHSIDRRPGSPLYKIRNPEIVKQYDPRWFGDLKEFLESADPAIPRALYYGDQISRDVGHARHVEGLPTIKTICLPGVRHNTVQAFHLDRLLDVFATLIEGRSDWPVPQASDPVAAGADINPGKLAVDLED